MSSLLPYSHSYINSDILPIIKEMDPIYVIIANKHESIQMRCPTGVELNESCDLYFRTILCVIMDMLQLRCVYWPRGICRRHKGNNNECRFWDFIDPSRKGKLGDGDEIFNLPKIVRGIPWGCKNKESAYSQFTNRYKFRLEFFQDFLRTIIVNSYGLFLYNIHH